MTDIPRPSPGDTDWIDWADDEEATSDAFRDGVSVTEMSATGTRDATTFLRGDNTWAAPSGSGGADATTTSKGVVQLAGDLGGTATAPTVPGLANRVPTTRQVAAGTGLSGGGDLSADRTFAVTYGTTTGTAAQGNDSRFGPSGRRQAVSAKTAAYTVVAGDEESLITVNTAATAAVTLPTGLPVGAWVEVLQLGAGQTTFTAGTGATLTVPTGATAACRGLNCRAVAQVIATNTWHVSGDLA